MCPAWYAQGSRCRRCDNDRATQRGVTRIVKKGEAWSWTLPESCLEFVDLGMGHN